MKNKIHVAAAAIINSKNEVLLSQRLEGTHLAGLWEFPGGKLEPGESIEHALYRELKEELDIQPTKCRPLIQVSHNYTEKSVVLDVWRVDDIEGEVKSMDGQALRWQAINRLDAQEMPAADVPIITALNLPEHYMITGKFESVQQFEQRLTAAMDNGIKLVQLRLTYDQLQMVGEKTLREVITVTQNLLEHTDVQLMYNLPAALQDSADIVNRHFNSHELAALNKTPDCSFWSASCHNIEQLQKAQQMGADFAVLSPVQHTSSHPDTVPLGWDQFSSLVERVNIPVYALGGVSPADVEQAWHAGAQGVAGIGAFWR